MHGMGRTLVVHGVVVDVETEGWGGWLMGTDGKGRGYYWIGNGRCDGGTLSGWMVDTRRYSVE